MRVGRGPGQRASCGRHRREARSALAETPWTRAPTVCAYVPHPGRRCRPAERLLGAPRGSVPEHGSPAAAPRTQTTGCGQGQLDRRSNEHAHASVRHSLNEERMFLQPVYHSERLEASGWQEGGPFLPCLQSRGGKGLSLVTPPRLKEEGSMGRTRGSDASRREPKRTGSVPAGRRKGTRIGKGHSSPE